MKIDLLCTDELEVGDVVKTVDCNGFGVLILSACDQTRVHKLMIVPPPKPYTDCLFDNSHNYFFRPYGVDRQICSGGFYGYAGLVNNIPKLTHWGVIKVDPPPSTNAPYADWYDEFAMGLIPRVYKHYLLLSAIAEAGRYPLDSFGGRVLESLIRESEREQEWLDKMFKMYVFVACLGEARHGKRSPFVRSSKATSELELLFDIVRGVPRQASWQKAFEWYELHNHELRCAAMEKAMVYFLTKAFEGSMGGPLWASIAETYLIDNSNSFIDSVVFRMHNCKIFVDKILGSYSLINVYQSILDLKFNFGYEELVNVPVVLPWWHDREVRLSAESIRLKVDNIKGCVA